MGFHLIVELFAIASLDFADWFSTELALFYDFIFQWNVPNPDHDVDLLLDNILIYRQMIRSIIGLTLCWIIH